MMAHHNTRVETVACDLRTAIFREFASVKFGKENGAFSLASDGTMGESLVQASRRGIQADEVRALLADGRAVIDVNSSDSTGWTALHYACARNNLSTAQVLLENGARAQKKDRWGETPLHAASKRGYLDCVKLLLDAGANPNSVDRAGKTPLFLVSESLRTDDNIRYQLLQILLGHGADPNFCMKDGTSVIHNACRRSSAEVVKLLVQHGASVHARDYNGDLPLHSACKQVCAHEIVRFLLEQGANPNARCRKHGFTPLHIACMQSRRGNAPTVHALRAFGADVEMLCSKGYPPVSFAADNLDIEVVQTMLV